jgi:hypothetical protein
MIKSSLHHSTSEFPSDLMDVSIDSAIIRIGEEAFFPTVLI